MNIFTKLTTGGIAAAALTVGFAAPAAAQYYPGPGGNGNVVIGAVLDALLRGNVGGYGGTYGAPYGGYGGYNQSSERYLIDQCARATEQRLNNQVNSRYGSGFRVVQVDRLERTRKGNLRVYGTAANNSYQGNYGGYGGGYNQPYGGYNAPYASGSQYRFSCKVDNRGRISDLDVNGARYGYNQGYRY